MCVRPKLTFVSFFYVFFLNLSLRGSINSPISPALHKPGLLTKFHRPLPFQVLPTLAEEHARLMWHGHDDGDEDHDVVIAAFA